MEQVLMYSVIALGVVIIALTVWIYHLGKRISDLSNGSTGSSLESIIKENHDRLGELGKVQRHHTSAIQSLFEKIAQSIQHIGVVRFNPYKETGGNQSFAIALTNEHKDGVVISTLYTRERVNVFAKPIKQGTSTFPLTKEEEQVLLETHRI